MITTKISNYTIKYTNKKEYIGLKEEIFGSDIYYFPLDKEKPVIVDCGSHIGLSIVYFKSQFPSSVIYGYEPNPISFKLLSENIENNGLNDITITNAAVDVKDGDKSFYIDTSEDMWLSTSGYTKGSWKKLFNEEEFKVQTIDFKKELQKIIDKHSIIDILKIDIEGYETKLLPSISDHFAKINNLVIEYHPIKHTGFKEVLDILKRNYNNMEFVQNGKDCKRPDPNELVIIRCLNERDR